MTKIRKSYLGIGIVFAVFALAISLMCIAFSYADVNAEDQAENQEEQSIIENELNDEYTITLNVTGDKSGVHFFKNFDKFIGDKFNLDDCTSYSIKESKLRLEFIYDEESNGPGTLFEAELDEGYTTSGWTYTKKSKYSENLTLNLNVTKITHFNISGEVMKKGENGDYIPGAYVKFVSEEDNTILETTSDQNGKFQFANIPISSLPSRGSDNDVYVVTTAKGYSYDTDNLDLVDLEGDTIYLTGEEALKLEEAFANLEGSTHHEQFVISLTETDEEGTETDTLCLPYVGIPWTPILSGIEFNIANDGSMVGTVSYMGVTITYSAKPVAEDGYTFDYWDINGQKYVAGQTYTIQDDTPLSIVSNYKKATIPATGDALPYAVVIGLGLIAIAAFVIARKQYNK